MFKNYKRLNGMKPHNIGIIIIDDDDGFEGRYFVA